MLLAAAGCSFVLKRTRVGRNLRSIGSSEAASRMAGLAIDRTRITAYVIFGFLTSVAGIGLAALLSSASANMSIGFELTVVAVAVVGGTSLLGGSGTLFGTVTGAILFAGLNNALNLFNVASYWQYIAAGGRACRRSCRYESTRFATGATRNLTRRPSNDARGARLQPERRYVLDVISSRRSFSMKAMQLDHVGPIESHPLHLREIANSEARPGRTRDEGRRVRASVARTCIRSKATGSAAGCRRSRRSFPGTKWSVTSRRSVKASLVSPSATTWGVQPLWSTDLSCEYCVTARDQLCPDKKVTGETIDGGYAEYMLANAAHTYYVPESLSPLEAAPLFCPGITAFRAVERAGLAPGQTVALFGMGGVGHMVVQFAKLAGADVIVVARGKRPSGAGRGTRRGGLHRRKRFRRRPGAQGPWHRRCD